MTKVRLTQPVGIRIEAARFSGISDPLLIELVQQRDSQSLLSAVDVQWSWDILFEYALQHEDNWKQALDQGYVFTFLTIRGLKSFLKFRFRLEEGIDYPEHDEVIEQLRLTKSDLEQLRSTVPDHWEITHIRPAGQDEVKIIRIALSSSSRNVQYTNRGEDIK